jgi:hypothetical protein
VVYGFVAVSLSPFLSRELLSWAAVPVALAVLASFWADWRAPAGRGLVRDGSSAPAKMELPH